MRSLNDIYSLLVNKRKTIRVNPRLFLVFCILLICGVCACKEEKECKVVVTETEYVLEHNGNYTFSLNAKGKVKNIGEVDLKKLL